MSSRCCKIDTVTRSESRCASELTRILGQSQLGVSRHLRLLYQVGLLERY
ncbi:MAG: ArsR family transcriptional regulator [Alphaproteobacteria bacterium]